MKDLIKIFIIEFIILFGLYAQNYSETLLLQYKDAVGDLDEDNLDSINEAVKIFKEIFSAKTDFASADTAFKEWQLLVDDALNSEGGRISGNGVDEDILDNAGKDMYHIKPETGMKKKTKEYLLFLEKKGIFVSAGEDGIGFYMSFDYIRKNFFGYLSQAMEKYLEMENEEITADYEQSDTPPDWEAVRNKIVEWENYLKDYPGSSVTEEAKDILKDQVMTYITGGEEGIKKDLLKKSYENFLKENKDSQYYQLVSEYYQYLETNNFQPDWIKADTLLNKYNK